MKRFTKVLRPLAVCSVACAAVVVALAAVANATTDAAKAVDPRAGGFEVALGEWSVVTEAAAIRPGHVRVVVTNRGRLAHGLRVRAAEHESGHGGGGHGGDGLGRTRVLMPGEKATLELDLAAGTYDVECFIEDGRGDHEELGMRAKLVVRADAPLVTPAPAKASGTAVHIRGFRFAPVTLRVKRGQTVRWTNDDAAPHTITAAKGSWSSKQLARSGTFVHRFTRAGTTTYICALHPSMRATIVVR